VKAARALPLSGNALAAGSPLPPALNGRHQFLAQALGLTGAVDVCRRCLSSRTGPPGSATPQPARSGKQQHALQHPVSSRP
jgi:hypothetical protein